MCCFEPPAYGGASTSAYQLFRELHRKVPVNYLSLVERRTACLAKRRFGDDYHNPEHLGGVWEYLLEGSTYKHQPGLEELIDDLSPGLLVGMGYIGGYVAKRARPDLPLVLITTGCQQVKDGLFNGAFDTVGELVAGDAAGPIYNDIEEEALDLADVVVTHSELTRTLYQWYFPRHVSKIFTRVIWFYDWIYGSAARSSKTSKAFDDRDIDILFVASEWSRVEKNYALVRTLCNRFGHRTVHIVGNTDDPLPNVEHHGLLPNRRVLELMSRAKTLVCPSRFDAAPGVLFEGAALGCNLVASLNCGNHQLCHPDLVVKDYNLDAFSERISRGLEQSFPSNTEYFSKQDGLSWLIDLLTQFHIDSAMRATCGG